MSKKRSQYISECEISAIKRVTLGGYKQIIAIEGKSKDLPVFICLHGGPGSPVPFSVGSRGLFPKLTDRFIMVYWDQLGCGINNYPLDNSFTIEHFVNMTVDLTKRIRARFPENKIYLLGISWGSILALHTSIRIPHLINGVVACGQVVKNLLHSDSTFDAVEMSSAPEAKKRFARDLRSRRHTASLREMVDLSHIVYKYTDGYKNHASGSLPVGYIVKGLLSSPDYNFKNLMGLVMNGYKHNVSLVEEMIAADLSELFKAVTVPYRIFQGETDVVTATSDVLELLNGLDNKNISCTVLPDSGHSLSLSAMKTIIESLNQNGV